MILIPIGRDNAVIQRHAKVTYAILAINVAVFMLFAIAHAGRDRALHQDLTSIQVLLGKYPFLRIPHQLEYVIGKDGVRQLEDRREPWPAVHYDRDGARRAQERLNETATSLVDNFRNQGTEYTFIPATSSSWMILVSMFVQISFLGLLAESFTLFSTAPYIEDAFGRPAFAALYLIGGLVAGLACKIVAPDSQYSFFGASGATAAVVGAFLVRFFGSRIEFLFVPFVMWPLPKYRFFVAAWAVVAFWITLQILWLSFGARFAAAYILSFVFGAAVATAMRLGHFEQRFVVPVVQQQVSWTLDGHLSAAMAAADEGRMPVMSHELKAYSLSRPSNPEELRMAYDFAVEKSVGDADVIAARLVDVLSEKQRLGECREFSLELLGQKDLRLPRFWARVAAFADKNGDRDLAMSAYYKLSNSDPDNAATVRHLLRISSLLKQEGDVAGAKAALLRARAHPACSVDARTTIDARLAQVDGREPQRAIQPPPRQRSPS